MKNWKLLTAVALILVGCQPANSTETTVQESSSSSSAQVSSSSSSSSQAVSQASSSSQAASQSSSSEEQPKSEPSKRVGDKGFGYVSVPTDWQPYKDMRGSDGVQFADSEQNVILTLDRIEESDLPAEFVGEYNAEDTSLYFYSIYAKSDDLAEVDLNVTTVASRQAYVITMKKSDEQYRSIWLFDGADGLVHSLTLEGQTAKVKKLSETIPASWHTSE